MFSLVLKSTQTLCAVCKSVCEVLPLLAVPTQPQAADRIHNLHVYYLVIIIFLCNI